LFSLAKFFPEIFPLLKNTEEELSIIDAPQHVDEEFQLGRLYFKLPSGQKIHKRALSKFVIKNKVSSERLRRVMNNALNPLTQELINSNTHLTISNYILLRMIKLAKSSVC